MHIRFQRASAQEDVVQALLDILVQRDLIDEWNDAHIPFFDTAHLFDFAGWTLRLLPPQMSERVLPVLLEMIRHQEQVCLRDSPDPLPLEEFGMYTELAHAILYFVFGETLLPQNAMPFLLTRTQRSVLTLLLTSKILATDALAERFNLFDLPYPWKTRLLLRIKAEPQKAILSRESTLFELR
jgi:hypothetical protein